MPSASSPEELANVLTEVARQALQQAADQPGALSDLIDRAVRDGEEIVDGVRRLPGDVLDALRELTDPPDWFSLAAFVLLRVAELDPHLSVGALPDTPEHGKALTLTYADPAVGNATVGFALFGEGPAVILLRATPDLDQRFRDPTFSFGFKTSGAVAWSIPLKGPVTAPAGPAGTITLTASLDVIAKSIQITPGLDASTGPLVAEIHLSTAAPVWSVMAALGTPPAKPGLHVGIDGNALLGPLSAVVSAALPNESYSPLVTIGQGSPPAFDLRHESVGT